MVGEMAEEVHGEVSMGQRGSSGSSRDHTLCSSSSRQHRQRVLSNQQVELAELEQEV